MHARADSARIPAASTSRLSLSSDTTVNSERRATTTAPRNGGLTARKPGQYSIASVLADDNAPAPLIPLPSLSSNPYLPTSISSLGTTFTSSALPPPRAGGKTVAQRRSQAPPVVISESRRAARTDFDAYLEQVGAEWNRWEKERKLGREGVAHVGTEGSSLVRAGVATTARRGLGIEGQDGEMEEDLLPKKRRSEEVLPSLEIVPQIFFDPAFNLANPHTFDLVTERIQSPLVDESELTPRPGVPSVRGPAMEPIPGLGPLTLADLATDQILQEKLSHYTAVVESHLVREIGLRSGSFFSALSNLQSLHQQGEDCLEKISKLQKALSPDEPGVGGAAKRGLQILRAQLRRRGLERIEEGVRNVEEVWSGVEGVRQLVEHGEWLTALEVGEQVESRYYGQDSIDTEVPTSSPVAPTPLNRIGSSSSLLLDKPKRAALDFTRVKSLSAVPQKLATFRAQIAKSLEGELIGFLAHEMETSVGDFMRMSPEGLWKGKGKELNGSGVGRNLTFSSITRLAESAKSVVFKGGEEESGEEIARERITERVGAIVRALVRAEGMEAAVRVWRDTVLKNVRSMVREHLPTGDAPEDEDSLGQGNTRMGAEGSSVTEKSASLARKLRAMPHGAFLSITKDTYLGLLGCIEVVAIHAQVLIELSSGMREEEHLRKSRRRAPPPPEPSSPPANGTSNSLTVPGLIPEPQSRPSISVITVPESSTLEDYHSLDPEILDVVHAAAELAHLRFSKVIAVRSDLHSTLPLVEFLEIFDLSWGFVVECEVICQRMIVGLRSVLIGQAKAFLQNFHQKRISDSARVIENEQWVAVDVPRATQAIVELLLESAVSDPEEFLLGARRRTTEVAKTNGENGSPPSAKQVEIEGRGYFSVAAGLASIEVLAEYFQLVMNCQLLTTDAMSKIIEYMKAFNSRTCQVVLGAGAMRSAGLKNITAKHLALASQALSIMISLIPYIRETLRRHLNQKQAVMLIEFDKLKRDFQEHQNEIHSKLVAIMSDRLQIHCKALEAIDWEQPGRKDLPNPYMESLVKEHMTLHKVLSRFLQPATVEYIMMQVLSALNSGLADIYGKIEIKSEAAKERMMFDVHYLKIKLAELKGLERGTPGAVSLFFSQHHFPATADHQILHHEQELENLISTKRLPEVARPGPTPRRVSSLVSSAPPAPSRTSIGSNPATSAPSSPAPASTVPLPIVEEAASATPPPPVDEVPPPPPTAPTSEPLPSITIDPSPDTLPPPIDQPPSQSPSPPLPAPPPIESPTPKPPPPRKSTLAERLALLARRSTEVLPIRSTPPTTPTATTVPQLPVVAEVADEKKKLEEGVLPHVPEAPIGGVESVEGVGKREGENGVESKLPLPPPDQEDEDAGGEGTMEAGSVVDNEKDISSLSKDGGKEDVDVIAEVEALVGQEDQDEGPAELQVEEDSEEAV